MRAMSFFMRETLRVFIAAPAVRLLFFTLFLGLLPRGFGATFVVQIGNFFFTPTNITVAPGDTVIWSNTVFMAHDTTHNPASGPRLWASPLLSFGETFSHTFTQPGFYPYVCAIHIFRAPEQTGTVTVASANLPPGVAITTPAHGATFIAPASFTVAANASDPDGAVTTVEFFLGGTSVGISFGPVFSASVNNLGTGSHTLTAVATDNAGARTTSSGVTISVQEAPMRFPLMLSVSPEGAGTVTADPPPPQDGYSAGMVVTLTASASEGFAFVRWSGAASGMENPIAVIMDSAKAAAAQFEPVTNPSFTLTLATNPPGAGAINVSPAPNGPSGTYLQGTTVTLTAVPSIDSVFTNWTGDVNSTGMSITLTMASNTVAAANFVVSDVRRFSLTVTATPPELGAVVLDPGPDIDGRYAEGTVVTLRVLRFGGSTFAGWSGDASGSAETVTVVMAGNRFVNATFVATPPFFTLTLATNPPGAGSILVSMPPRADGTYAAGTPVAVAAIPNTGFRFAGWGGTVPPGTTNNPLIVTGAVSQPGPAQSIHLVAQFDTQPPLNLGAASGNFSGLVFDEAALDFTVSGFASLRVTRTGRFRGRAVIGGISEPVAGQFDRFGYAPFVMRRGTLSGSLQIGDSGDLATGSLTDGRKAAPIELFRAGARTNASGIAGAYAIAFNTTNDLVSTGSATAVVSPGGAVRVRGILGDGTRFVERSFVTAENRVPISVLLYLRHGSLIGWMNVADDGTLSGTAHWHRPADSRSRSFPNGFAIPLTITGHRRE